MLARRFHVSIVVVGYLLALQPGIPLQGCAPAPYRGQWVDISDESALIVWNSNSKTEHFVRRARFETTSDDFGFLVPTPTQPELGEVNDHLFNSAASLTAPKHVYRYQNQKRFGFGDWIGEKSTAAGLAPNAMPQGVQVLDEQQVAGFDAAVLRADDPQSLADWLNQHGYESRPALTEWLKWYVDNKWIITAFKLSRGSQPNPNRWDAKAIRMSFQTDRPFYPYREPADMRKPSAQGARTLRVYVLSDQRYEGTIGDSGEWPAQTHWANTIAGMESNITSQLSLSDPNAQQGLSGLNYLTEFEDKSFPRPGTDEVYFRPAADQSPKERPAIVHTIVNVEYIPGVRGTIFLVLMVPLVAFLILMVVLRRRSRRTAQVEV